MRRVEDGGDSVTDPQVQLQLNAEAYRQGEAGSATPAERLARMTRLLKELSAQTDPDRQVRDFAEAMGWFLPSEAHLSLSRRDLKKPQYRITRASNWDEKPNPWKQRSRLPIFSGGLLADLIYGGEPVVINDLQLEPDEPAAEYLQGVRSLMALPHYHDGEGLNMAVRLSDRPNAFDPDWLPEVLLIHNLFGRATNNLVLSEQLRLANRTIERELAVVGEIQRSLLPEALPCVEGLELAAHYETARRAGGDYYDIFCLGGNRVGILIADVSGHGTPAAVVMAVTHALAHSAEEARQHPGELLAYLNRHLCLRYTSNPVMFITAFYAVIDASTRSVTCACAGHNPPRLIRRGEVIEAGCAAGVPLGIDAEHRYEESTLHLEAGDVLALYTDGITEAFNDSGVMFGPDRLDAALEAPAESMQALVERVVSRLAEFEGGESPRDDRTLVAIRVG